MKNKLNFDFEKTASKGYRISIRPLVKLYDVPGDKPHVKHFCPVCHSLGVYTPINPEMDKCPVCGANLHWTPLEKTKHESVEKDFRGISSIKYEFYKPEDVHVKVTKVFDEKHREKAEKLYLRYTKHSTLGTAPLLLKVTYWDDGTYTTSEATWNYAIYPDGTCSLHDKEVVYK